MTIGAVVVPRRPAVCVAGALALVAAMLDQPLWSATALVVLVAVAVVPAGDADALAWLPVALVLALGVAMGLVTVAGVAGIALWAEGLARITWAIAIAVMTGVALLRGGVVRLWSGWSLAALLVMLPMALALGSRLGRPLAFWSAPVWEVGDWMNHGEMAVDIRMRGLLDFAAPTPASAPAIDIYPRGLHGVLAWLTAVGDGSPGARMLWEQVLWSLQATAAVFAVAAGLASGVLLVRAARAFLPTPRAAGVTAGIGLLAVAVAFALPGWFDPLVWAGYVTTAGAAVTLAAVMLVLVDVTSPTTRLVVVGLLCAVLFSLWQLAALPALVLVLALAWQWWRAGHRGAVAVVASAVVAAAMCLPLALASVTARGAEQVSAAGGFPSLPAWVSAAVGVGALAAGWWLGRGSAWRLGLPMLLGGLLALGAVIAIVAPASSGGLPYYAGKLLWHATVLGLPIALAGLGWTAHRGWRLLAPLRRRSPLVAGAVAAALVVLPGAAISGLVSAQLQASVPVMAGPMGSEPPRPLDVLDATGDDVAGRAVLPWGLRTQGWDPWRNRTDWQAAQVVRALGAVVPAIGTLVGHDADAACAFLDAHPDAVRVTGLASAPAELIETGCPAEVVRATDWVLLPDLAKSGQI